MLSAVVALDYRVHLLLGAVIRLCLVIYGGYHDEHATVPYTDVDYKVFTDAARHVLNNQSPYDRHTYRYSPLIAYLLIPNITLHPSFGKLLFIIFDVLNALLIRVIVKKTVSEYSAQYETKRKKGKSLRNNKENVTGTLAMLFWVYNPLSIAISSRGNCDSIATFLVLFTLYLLQCSKQSFLAGLVHGVSVHFRLYPVIYSLTFFMYLSKFSFYSTEDRRKRAGVREITGPPDASRIQARKPEKKTIFKKKYLYYLVPNLNQILLVQGALLSFLFLTFIFFAMYGMSFLNETYIYHFFRKDTRHNFSLYFYLQYLTAFVKNVGLWQKALVVLPQVVLLLVLSIRYGLNRFSLNFSILTQTIVMVTYNSVLTSQYFVWVMAILPLCLWQISITVKNAIFLFLVWVLAQGAWLLPAYFLEFHGQNTFLFIWIQGVSFFCANIAILGRLIMYFMPISKEKTK